MYTDHTITKQRACKSCGVDITHLHGNCRVCEDCTPRPLVPCAQCGQPFRRFRKADKYCGQPCATIAALIEMGVGGSQLETS